MRMRISPLIILISLFFVLLQENEIVNVMYEINAEWLYGSNSYGQYGQFPSNYIEFIPHNLPPMPK